MSAVLVPFLMFALALFLWNPLTVQAAAGDTVDIQVEVTFHQDWAREQLDLVNAFRTDTDNPAQQKNTSEVWETVGPLYALKYDYELEKTAMQRAAEIAIAYNGNGAAHQRPDGTWCDTAFPVQNNDKSENLAACTTAGAQIAFDIWKEEDEPYSKQGHRRGMLTKSCTSIGIACAEVKIDGLSYYFWVQNFRSAAPEEDLVPTAANNALTEMTITSVNNNLSIVSGSLTQDYYEMQAGDSAAAPSWSGVMEHAYSWPEGKRFSANVNPVWTISDPNVVKIENGNIIALSNGTATLTSALGDQTLSVTVLVGDAPTELVLSLTSSGVSGSGSVATLTGGGTYTFNSRVTVSATTVPGYRFLGWFDGNNLLSSNLNYSFNIVRDMSLVAKYQEEGSVNLTIHGTDVLVNGNAAADGSTVSFPVGSSVSLQYNGSGVFGRWENVSGNTVSTKKSFDLTLTRDLIITASVKNVTEGSTAFVEFVSPFGQIMASGVWDKSQANAYSLPAGPSKMGSTFKYWSLDGSTEATVQDILNSISAAKKHIVVKPVYETASGTNCRITIWTLLYDLSSPKIEYIRTTVGEKVSYTAPDEYAGAYFSHWCPVVGDNNTVRRDTVLSTSNTISFQALGEVKYAAVYREAASVAAKAPKIYIAGTRNITVDGVDKFSVSANRDIIDGYEVISHGFIYSLSSMSDSALRFIDDINRTLPNGVKEIRAGGKDSKGTFTVNVKKSAFPTICLRAFAEVRDSNGEISMIYSDVVNYPE